MLKYYKRAMYLVSKEFIVFYINWSYVNERNFIFVELKCWFASMYFSDNDGTPNNFEYPFSIIVRIFSTIGSPAAWPWSFKVSQKKSKNFLLLKRDWLQPKIIFTDKGLCEYRRTIMSISRAAIYWMEKCFRFWKEKEMWNII